MKLFHHNTDTIEETSTDRGVSRTPEPVPPQVYPGNMPLGRTIDIPTPIARSRNRRIVKRRTSPFTIILVLLGAAVAIVLYISNIIAVNQLMAEINVLQSQYNRITMEQEILKAQINKMASLERIQEKAQQELNLKNPSTSPVWIKIDQEKLNDLEEARKEP